MSSTTKEVLNKVRQMVPPMLEKFHKGQLGRVGVLGGSEDYTGAPYFSGMASARLGCDMVSEHEHASSSSLSSPQFRLSV
ncbi:hypothetical protein NPX13_g2633 [Xylaria arbuscula]|uniref:YjeF C-terminal domain-containing protein n=1 Tax=Xylaria arbuscula TaxID=114810 RepID=A0A9W8TQX1_9PEZI|nr:hypothetical protein NPX13_g2633 [Xylaria arbuscula]